MADDSKPNGQSSETAIFTFPTPPGPLRSRDNAHKGNSSTAFPGGLEPDSIGQGNLQDIIAPIAVHADAEWTTQEDFENHASTPAIDVPPASGQHGAEVMPDNGSYLDSKFLEESPLEEFMRNRRTSISFDPKVKLETGHERAIEEPLPKLEINTRLRRESLLQDLYKPTPRSPLSRAYSEAGSGGFDSVTGEPIRSLLKHNNSLTRARPPHNRSRYPLLQSTVNVLPSEKEQPDLERASSLTSDSTASLLTEVRTPTEESMDCLVSPISTYSPFHHPVSLEESSAWPKPHLQHSSSRAKSYTFDRKLSIRSANRSRRSTSSSISPATAFLSKFTPREEDKVPPEPDSEGQEVGEYVLGKQVGFGGFSIVREAYTFEGGARTLRAVKIVRRIIAGKTEPENEQFQAEFEREVGLWRCLGHRHILPLIAVYVTPFATFCFTKLNEGGTLFDLVRANRNGLRHDLARRYAYQLASAIRYLHEDMRVVHRDIKLENCLIDLSTLDAVEEGGNLLLCDFGLAEFTTRTPRRRSPSPSSDITPYGSPPTHDPYETAMRHHIGPSETSTSIAGSLQYAAPELIMSPAGLLSTAVDIWAYGVVIYALMVGDLPFQHVFQPRVQMMILAGEWDLGALRGAEGVREAGREDEVEEVVQGCLEMRSQERWTIGRVLGCKWMEGCQEVVEEAGGWKL